MAQPYNYMIPQTSVLDTVLSGLRAGAAIGELARQKREQDRLAAEQQRAALFQTDMASFLTDPTPRKSIDLIKKYPEYVEKIQAGRKAGEEAEDRAEFDLVKNMFVAANNGDIDYAKGLMQKHIDVLKAEGKDTAQYEPVLSAFDSGNANKVIGYLSSQAAALYPDEWIKTSEAMEKSKQEQAKSEKFLSEAKTAASQAKFSDSILASQLAKSNWDIKKLQSDIDVAQQNKRIAAMEAVYKRETDDLRRQELQGKIADAKAKREEVVRNRVSDLSNSLANNQNLLTTIDDLLGMSYEKDEKGNIIKENDEPVFSSTIESATGPISEMLPTFSQDTADFQEKVETIKNQVTMANLEKMKGVLSDTDLKVLQGVVQSLSLRQSPKAFTDNLKTIKKLTTRANDMAREKYGAPAIDKAAATLSTNAGVSVNLPSGQSFTFPDQQSADSFLKMMKERIGGSK